MSWWIDANTAPESPGVYRVKLAYAPFQAWARWDGEHWCAWGTDRARANRATFSGPDRGYQWRAG